MSTEKDKPIFDEGDRTIDKFMMECNDCKDLNDKIKKAEHEYEIKKTGANIISNPESREKMLNQINNTCKKKLDQFKSIKERHCSDKT